MAKERLVPIWDVETKEALNVPEGQINDFLDNPKYGLPKDVHMVDKDGTRIVTSRDKVRDLISSGAKFQTADEIYESKAKLKRGTGFEGSLQSFATGIMDVMPRMSSEMPLDEESLRESRFANPGMHTTGEVVGSIITDPTNWSGAGAVKTAAAKLAERAGENILKRGARGLIEVGKTQLPQTAVDAAQTATMAINEHYAEDPEHIAELALIDGLNGAKYSAMFGLGLPLAGKAALKSGKYATEKMDDVWNKVYKNTEEELTAVDKSMRESKLAAQAVLGDMSAERTGKVVTKMAKDFGSGEKAYEKIREVAENSSREVFEDGKSIMEKLEAIPAKDRVAKMPELVVEAAERTKKAIYEIDTKADEILKTADFAPIATKAKADLTSALDKIVKNKSFSDVPGLRGTLKKWRDEIAEDPNLSFRRIAEYKNKLYSIGKSDAVRTRIGKEEIFDAIGEIRNAFDGFDVAKQDLLRKMGHGEIADKMAKLDPLASVLIKVVDYVKPVANVGEKIGKKAADEKLGRNVIFRIINGIGVTGAAAGAAIGTVTGSGAAGVAAAGAKIGVDKIREAMKARALVDQSAINQYFKSVAKDTADKAVKAGAAASAMAKISQAAAHVAGKANPKLADAARQSGRQLAKAMAGNESDKKRQQAAIKGYREQFRSYMESTEGAQRDITDIASSVGDLEPDLAEAYATKLSAALQQLQGIPSSVSMSSLKPDVNQDGEVDEAEMRAFRRKVVVIMDPIGALVRASEQGITAEEAGVIKQVYPKLLESFRLQVGAHAEGGKMTRRQMAMLQPLFDAPVHKTLDKGYVSKSQEVHAGGQPPKSSATVKPMHLPDAGFSYNAPVGR